MSSIIVSRIAVLEKEVDFQEWVKVTVIDEYEMYRIRRRGSREVVECGRHGSYRYVLYGDGKWRVHIKSSNGEAIRDMEKDDEFMLNSLTYVPDDAKYSLVLSSAEFRLFERVSRPLAQR